MSKVYSVSKKLPAFFDFYLIWRKSKNASELAYHCVDCNGEHRWQKPDTVGDKEGLNIEYFEDVEFWTDLIFPTKEGV